MKTRSAHEYLSTACWHELNEGKPDLHGSCRASCKFGEGEFCTCPNHPENDARSHPLSWVDQARGGFLRLLAHLPAAGVDLTAIDPHLARAIADDPAWFWARGEIQPDGVRTPPATDDITG